MIELIRPNGANINVWSNLLPIIQSSVGDIQNAGMEVVKIDANDHFRYIHLKYRDMMFTLHVDDLLKAPEIKSFIMHIEKIYQIAKSFDTVSDPFYDNINRSVKSVLGESYGRHIAYSAICSYIVNTGKRIWS